MTQQKVYDPDSDSQRAPIRPETDTKPSEAGVRRYQPQVGGTNRLNNSIDSSGDDLNAQENNAALDRSSNLGDTKSLGQAQLANQEKSGASFNFTNDDNVSGFQKAKQFAVKNRRKGFVGGGVIGLLIAVFTIGIAGIATEELVSLEKDFVHYESMEESREEKKAGQRLVRTILCRALPTGGLAATAANCRKQGPDENETTAEEASDDRLPLAKAMDDFNFTDPDVINDLGNQGITVKLDTNGKFNGFTDEETGQSISADDIANSDTLFSRFEAGLPEWEAGQSTSFQQLMEDHSGSTFDVVPEDAPGDEDGATDVQNSVLDTSSNPELTEANVSDNETDPNQPAGSPGETAFITGQEESGIAGKSVSATDKAIAAGKTETEALQDGEDAANSGGNVLLANTAASEICSVEKVADKSSIARKPTIMALLIRHGTTFISLADELKSGKIKGKVVAQVMSLFTGNPALRTGNSTVIPDSAGLPIQSSAEYQRMEGDSIGQSSSTNYANDLDPSSRPTEDAGNRVVSNIDHIMSSTKVGTPICVAENSRFGSVIGGLIGIGQLALDNFTFGVGQVIIITGTLAVQQTIVHVVIPQILKYFTPVGLYGREDSVQWGDNLGAGLDLGFNDYSREHGAEPLSNSTANDLVAEADSAQNTIESHQSWTNRTFALSNPQSLMSHFVSELPTTHTVEISGIASYFSNFPGMLEHGFATIMTPKRALAATNSENPGEPYGITQYGFTDADINRYDPIANEQYLNGTISYDGGTPVKRITLLGDPNSFAKDPDSDTSTTDVLHCFTQTYDNSATNPVANETNGNNDPICGSVGSYDYAADTPDPITDSMVAISYCDQLAPGNLSCPAAIAPLLNDDIGHFREYLLDVHVMSDYSSLVNNND